MAHQLEQLLTCCICLDRFRNPKLLPCQHSVCMEPCMEGLVDYVRRQVKCPECRAEHRIPYNGVQGFPSNVTLQRFLEAHIEITGETPDPHTGQYMERCNVCNEKNYLSVCAHCDKKICEDCKAAHSDILKREIGRINNQVKRAAHRLNDQLSTVERNIVSLKQNTHSVSEEIENISKRLQKSVKDRCSFLKSEVENYYTVELKNLNTLKESLDQEVSNINANIDLAEKHMDDNTPWDDAELMDTKDIFLKTMEFIRSFDYEAGDYSRRARFNPPDDLNKLVSSLTSLGDLSFSSSNKASDNYGLSPSLGSGLMKSKSDHRLAAQFRDQEDAYGYSGRTSPLMRRRFGERTVERHDEDSPADSGRRRFRSRFMRKEEDEDRSVRFSEEEGPKRQRVFDTEDVSRGPLSGIVRLFDSPRVMKRFQERDQLKNKKKEEPPPKPPQPSLPKPPVTPLQRKTSRQTSEDEIDKIKKQNKSEASSSSAGAAAASPISSSTPSTPSTPTTPKPAGERVSSIREDTRQSRSDRTSTSPRSSANHSPTSSVTREDDSTRRRGDTSTSATTASSRSAAPSRKTSVDTGVTSVAQRSYPFSRSSSNSSVGDKDKSASGGGSGGGSGSGTRTPRQLDTASYERRLSRSNSTDSNKSAEGTTSPKKPTGAAFSTEELKNRFSRQDSRPSTSKAEATGRSGESGRSRFQSRFLGRAGTPSVEASKESENDDDDETTDDSESEESEESSDEEEEEEEEEEKTTTTTTTTTTSRSRPDIGPLLGRSAQSRDVGSSSTSTSSRWGDRSSYPPATSSSSGESGYSSRYGSSSDTSNGSTTSSRYGASSSMSNDSGVGSALSHRRPSYVESKPPTKEKEEDFESKYPYSSKYLNRSKPAEEEPKSNFHSRFLNRSKSSAVLGPDDNTDDSSSGATHGTSRARFEELKERRQRLARSRSSAGLEDEDSAAADTSSSASNYRSRYGRDTSSPSSRSGAAASPASGTSGGGGSEEGGSSSTQLSNWARYLKNKYGNRSNASSGDSNSRSTLSSSGMGSSGSSSSAAGGASASSLLGSGRTGGRAITRSRSSHLLGLAKEGESSEDDSKNVHATPTSPLAGTGVPTPFGSFHRSQYLQKQRLLLKIGSRGSEQGNFTWPRGIAVGPDNSIVVADSSNHRVQVFDQHGKFVKEFGSYGSAEGEFDCLAGVAVNRIGQFIIADRYNHRIQVFDPSGNFLRSFGSQGSGDGRFSYPWGVTTDALGFIYVCDKENHRVQVFQSDGSFVGKFGSIGSKPGQLEHPHYIAVSSTNRVIVSDSNNHRIQIFDINGKVTTTFGSEGSDDGQFKFPRGVAVDDQGYIFVADSGNNRIQIFHPDGTFLRAFGCWGSGEGEFKGLEGVAVMSNGNILVCDRENHRVQVF
ncbi:RING finger protein nhl-1-like [Eriocheir sinensis]|uniref:RING finger protein nhl-1-like n=1 Tax=Eriocheir sinensis TaxID=95602 RepID=UPI0021C9FFD9|nr:RING finger protein nhl-1-like [Eriocheir sinensis]XP_050691987.1 RING finger protein nhl-1-like [Eriocheir sinensis]XP_050691988.1 RING finger protein nhl-1-like [Eriocheir sinensis]XP_050691989.1 RING finger protein nhl-1-like [Eriocheir sinensis]